LFCTGTENRDRELCKKTEVCVQDCTRLADMNREERVSNDFIYIYIYIYMRERERERERGRERE
jgi:hypothetical protein